MPCVNQSISVSKFKRLTSSHALTINHYPYMIHVPTVRAGINALISPSLSASSLIALVLLCCLLFVIVVVVVDNDNDGDDDVVVVAVTGRARNHRGPGGSIQRGGENARSDGDHGSREPRKG